MQARVVEVGVDIAAHHHEGRIVHQRERLGDAAADLKRGRFRRIADARAEAGTVAQRALDHRAQVRVVHDEIGEAGAHELFHLPLDERPAARGHQRLGDAVRERAQALAPAGREDDRARHQDV